MTNRLAASTSPYLQQHRDNPVDWWEWGADAFAEAKRRDVPILLSVGYAACHWCHVMARESFEDDATAALMNAGFVNVKVDREERPDVDAVYMSATTALSGHGGWPMTVFTTPDGRPFHAGTYYPPAPRGGMPSFRQLLTAVGEAWTERRDDVEGAGARISEALAGTGLEPGGEPPGADRLAGAVVKLAAEEDTEHGGFGAAPKFPPSMVLEFLLRHAARARLEGGTGDGNDHGAAALAGRTLRAMAHSGMYDQLAGGFARYAVDRAWVVPHFEKMLYDNALLARVYLHWWRLTGEPAGARIAEETCDWLLAGLRTEQGGFASSLDADTPVAGEGHGVEGLTYVWTPQQLTVVLGEDAGWAAKLLRVDAAGTFEHGTSTLQLDRDVWADDVEAARWRDVRARLLAERGRRPQPHRDDKVVAAWNGLAIAALAETGALLGRPEFVHAAASAADLLLRVHAEEAPDGLRLRRVSRDGRAGHPSGVLEDYGDVAEGLLALHAVTGSPRWLTAAGRLLDTVLTHFADPGEGLFDTADDDTDAALAGIRRPQDPSDNAYPSGWSAAAGALLSYAALTGSAPHRDVATAALGVMDVFAERAPRFAGWGLAVAEAALDGPREVAVAGAEGDGGRARLHAVALAGTAPGAVVSVGEPDAPEVPLLSGRPLREQRATAYVCRGFVCDAPVTEADRLARSLGTRPEVVEDLSTAMGMD